MYPNIAAKMAAVNKRRVDGAPQDGPPQAVPMPIFGGAPAQPQPPANNGGLLTGGYMKPDMPPQAPPQATPMPDHGNALAALFANYQKPDTGWYGQDAFPPQAQPWPDMGAMYGNLLGVGGATARGQGVNGGNRSSTYAGQPSDDYRHMLGWGTGY